MIVFISTLLLLHSWISVSSSEFVTVEVQPGDEVTLMCSNLSRLAIHICWFKPVNRHNTSCISSILSPESNATLCDGYKNSTKFVMTSNKTNIFLTIKQVNIFDSGLYFCGYYENGLIVLFGVTSLQVKDVIDGLFNVPSVIFGFLTALPLMVIISLVARIRKFHTAQTERQNPHPSQKLDSVLCSSKHQSFPRKRRGPERQGGETELESHVVYDLRR